MNNRSFKQPRMKCGHVYRLVNVTSTLAMLSAKCADRKLGIQSSLTVCARQGRQFVNRSCSSGANAAVVWVARAVRGAGADAGLSLPGYDPRRARKRIWTGFGLE